MHDIDDKIKLAIAEISRGSSEIIDLQRVEYLVKRFYETGETHQQLQPQRLHLIIRNLLNKLKLSRMHLNQLTQKKLGAHI